MWIPFRGEAQAAGGREGGREREGIGGSGGGAHYLARYLGTFSYTTDVGLLTPARYRESDASTVPF